MARIDPLRKFRYRLEIDNITQAGFSEVAIELIATESLPNNRKRLETESAVPFQP